MVLREGKEKTPECPGRSLIIKGERGGVACGEGGNSTSRAGVFCRQKRRKKGTVCHRQKAKGL